MDKYVTPYVQPAGALRRLAAPGSYFGRDVLRIESCSSSGLSYSLTLFVRLVDTMESVLYNNGVEDPSATVGLQARILKASSGLWLFAPGLAASTLTCPAQETMSSQHYNIGMRGGQCGKLRRRL